MSHRVSRNVFAQNLTIFDQLWVLTRTPPIAYYGGRTALWKMPSAAYSARYDTSWTIIFLLFADNDHRDPRKHIPLPAPLALLELSPQQFGCKPTGPWSINWFRNWIGNWFRDWLGDRLWRPQISHPYFSRHPVYYKGFRHTPILRTSRLIYSEAVALFYSELTIIGVSFRGRRQQNGQWRTCRVRHTLSFATPLQHPGLDHTKLSPWRQEWLLSARRLCGWDDSRYNNQGRAEFRATISQKYSWAGSLNLRLGLFAPFVVDGSMRSRLTWKFSERVSIIWVKVSCVRCKLGALNPYRLFSHLFSCVMFRFDN